MDFWSAEDSKQNSVDVLVVMDHFTKLGHAFPYANQTAKQVARKLWDHIFCAYGFPERIDTDQGANFESGFESGGLQSYLSYQELLNRIPQHTSQWATEELNCLIGP